MYLQLDPHEGQREDLQNDTDPLIQTLKSDEASDRHC